MPGNTPPSLTKNQGSETHRRDIYPLHRRRRQKNVRTVHPQIPKPQNITGHPRAHQKPSAWRHFMKCLTTKSTYPKQKHRSCTGSKSSSAGKAQA